MENERHVVVESPDGCVSLGTNPDIEAPQSVDEPQLQQYPHLEIIVKYPEINRMVLWMFLWLGLYALSIRFSVADVLNIMFLVVTLYAVYSEKLRLRPILVFHSTYCFFALPIAVIFTMWIDAVYLFALGIFTLITLHQSMLEVRERT
jgi:hypothetical protein